MYKRQVRVNHQTGVVTNVLFHAIAFEMFADLGGTTALPDNGVIDRFAGFFFPDNSGFTLVRNTDSCNLIEMCIRDSYRAAAGRLRWSLRRYPERTAGSPRHHRRYRKHEASVQRRLAGLREKTVLMISEKGRFL